MHSDLKYIIILMSDKMKFLTLACFNFKIDKEFYECVANNTFSNNSLFSYKNNKFFKKNKWSKEADDQFEVQFLEINLDNERERSNFIKLVVNTIYDAHELTKDIRSEKIKFAAPLVYGESSIESTVVSLVNAYCYGEIKNISDFVIKLGERIITGHFWKDGNKRTGMITIKLLFSQFGLWLSWSNDVNSNEYAQRWENTTIRLVESSQNRWRLKENRRNEIFNEFKKEILNGLMFDISKIK